MSGEVKQKGIVFDFDGTLLDSTTEGAKRFIGIARLLNLPVSEHILARIKKMWGVPGPVMIEACWPDISANIFMDCWETFDSRNRLALFPGVKETVERLASRYLLSLLTSRSWSTRFQLECNNLKSLFPFIYTLDDCPEPKPHPRSIEPLLGEYQRRGIELHDVVFVGDSVHSDYGLARTIGMRFIAITWGNNTREDFLNAGMNEDHIIDTIEHLSYLIDH